MDKELTWFQLMWKNGYIQLFVVAITMLIYCIINWNSFYDMEIPFTDTLINGAWLMFLISISMILLISISGFYKFWKYYNTLK